MSVRHGYRLIDIERDELALVQDTHIATSAGLDSVQDIVVVQAPDRWPDAAFKLRPLLLERAWPILRH